MSSPTEPAATVFIQAWNTERFVDECIDSVLTQRGAPEFEVVIIDDGSTDSTAARIARFTDRRLRVIVNRPNRGAVATANDGYRQARGEFVLRLDSDDRLRPECLARTVDALRAHPECGFAYADVSTIDQHGAVLSPRHNVARQDRPFIGDEFFPLLLENYVPAPTTLVRRTLLQLALPVPEHYRFLDWHVTTAVAESAPTVYLDEPLADYRLHTTNMHRAMIADRRGEATSLAILDRLFASPLRQEEKREWRRTIYARHYATYGDKYFGCGMTGDARRCYAQALRFSPVLVTAPGIMRRLAATLVGRGVYDAAKAVVTGKARA